MCNPNEDLTLWEYGSDVTDFLDDELVSKRKMLRTKITLGLTTRKKATKL